jgi:hypothetical protein
MSEDTQDVDRNGANGSHPGSSKAATATPPTKAYRASITRNPLPAEFVASASKLRESLGGKVFLLVHHETFLDDDLTTLIRAERTSFPRDAMTILLDSPGGYAKNAYQIARLFQRSCDKVTVAIARYAKSAATLLSLGMHRIVMAPDAELGPLDAQFDDREREEGMSALDEVQALERLHVVALECVDRTMNHLLMRTGKKVNVLLPTATAFVAEMMRPLMENIDIVHYTQMSRVLKVAEEYAVRLLVPRYTQSEANRIARHLVSSYPEHGFAIDHSEARKIGIQHASVCDSTTCQILDEITDTLSTITAVGWIEEIPHDS